MFYKSFVVLVTFFIFSDSSFVANLPICQIDDSECLKNLAQKVLEGIGEDGVPELRIPPVNPIRVKNFSIKFLYYNITLLDGFLRGVKDCVFHQLSLNGPERKGYVAITCDLIISGQYRIGVVNTSVLYAFQNFAIHGEGNGSVKIDKMQLKFDFQFYTEPQVDSEIYMKCNFDHKNKYEIEGLFEFSADNLYIGDQDASQGVLQILNENNMVSIQVFATSIIQKSLEFAAYFTDSVPARHYIIEDLTAHSRR